MIEPRPPKVSVCVPAYKAEAFLSETIESVLSQTFRDWELIVLDNASPDRTGAIARSYDDPRIRVERNAATLSLADNWNAVASMARGEYLKLLCADDPLAPSALAREVEALDRHPKAVMTAVRRDFISASGRCILRNRGLRNLIGLKPAAEVVGKVVRSGVNPIGWPSALLIRRADFEAVGGFDRRWLHPIDLELWLRMLTRGDLYGIDESLVAFRVSSGSVTAQVKGSGQQHRAMLRDFASRSSWPIDRLSLWLGLGRSVLAQVSVWLMFHAVNSRYRLLNELPRLVLEGRRTETDWMGSHRRGDGSDWSAADDLAGTWIDDRPSDPISDRWA